MSSNPFKPNESDEITVQEDGNISAVLDSVHQERYFKE